MSATPTMTTPSAAASVTPQTIAQAPTIMMDVSELPIPTAVNRLIDHAVTLGCSDLFFLSNEKFMLIHVRHLGLIRPISVVDAETGRKFTSHIKASASMDVGEKRRPLDGRWIHETTTGDFVDLRINSIPTMYGEDLALRLLARTTQLFQLENLGFIPQQLDLYKNMLDNPGGMILITGPTGSGKTATLYASLNRLNDGSRKINTIEDPIEFSVDGLRQSQINPLIDLNFAELLRSIIRQSPDVIMIGEIRDRETADAAVRAANSGHKVFATLHAPLASSAIQSMRSLGVHPHFLATALRGIVSQRLLRTLCLGCRKQFDLSFAPDTFGEVKKWLAPDEGKVLYAPGPGCEKCQGTGYDSRIGAFEVLEVSSKIRQMISDDRPSREIRQAALDQGMLDFRSAALLHVARGKTSTEELFRVIPSDLLLESE